MIHVIVEQSYLWDLVGARPKSFQTSLFTATGPLLGLSRMKMASVSDLPRLTVFEVMKQFHEQLRNALPKDVVNTLREDILSVAKRYGISDFESSEENAANLLATHDVLSHGCCVSSSNQRRPVFFPDLCHATSFYCYFRPFAVFESEGVTAWSRMANLFKFLRHAPGLRNGLTGSADYGIHANELECHLCDTLQEVRDRAQNWFEKHARELRTQFDGNFDDLFCKPTLGKQFLVIEPVVNGFSGYFALSRMVAGIPPLGDHRVFGKTLTRLGIARPTISRLFPIHLWSQMEQPVRQFLLDAGEIAASSSEGDVEFPMLPTEKEIRTLLSDIQDPKKYHQDDLERHPAARKLQINRAIEKRRSLIDENARDLSFECDLIDAIESLGVALCSRDVTESVRLQNVLDLYPLHKRVLSLVESLILPKLKPLGTKGSSSRLWLNGFLDTRTDNGKICPGPLYDHPQKSKLNDLAILETNGNWLIVAAAHEALGEPRPMDLATILDGIVENMSSAPELAGLSITLNPATPQMHAVQLDKLADRQAKNAACMTLYLGKLAFELRNYIEHGQDEVAGDFLVIDGTHFWEENRTGNYKWVMDSKRSWRNRARLPCKGTNRPKSADAFLLSPASMHRCLVLLSLVLHGAMSHLEL